MISNVKHCSTVAFIATRKHTRTRRWSRQSPHKAEKKGLRQARPSRAHKATQGPQKRSGQGLDKPRTRRKRKPTAWPSRTHRPRQGLDKAGQGGEHRAHGTATAIVASSFFIRENPNSKLFGEEYSYTTIDPQTVCVFQNRN